MLFNGVQDDQNIIAVDHTLPLLIFSGIAAVIAVMCVCFFRPKYKRLLYENKSGVKLQGLSYYYSCRRSIRLWMLVD